MVIQTQEQLLEIQTRFNTEPVYVLPVFVNQYTHIMSNTVSSLHLLFENGDYACIPYRHLDAHPMQLDTTTPYNVRTLYKKDLLLAFDIPQAQVVDVATLLQMNNQSLPELRDFFMPSMLMTKNQFKFMHIHLAIPLMNWMECGERFLQHLKTLYEQYATSQDSAYTFTSTIVIPTLAEIERAGLHVEDASIIEHFGENSKKYITNNTVYSNYNIYTSTGRPSNAFGGINFAALNKTDGSRSAFTSRFGNDGVLIQFDYEAFHLRLVASKIGYTLPDTSIHTYLAQQYYNVSEVTPDQYEASKARTFAIMYGQTDDMGDVELFHRIRDYSATLWNQYEQQGYVQSSMGRKIAVPQASQNKVFNYMMQITETEEALLRIQQVTNFLSELRTKIVLYTYDAILLDCHTSEIDVLPTIELLLSSGGCNVRQYTGVNYDALNVLKI